MSIESVTAVLEKHLNCLATTQNSYLYRMKILLAEDEPAISGFIKRGLEEEGYRVTQAFDGKQGKMLLQNTPYDLIILDVILPELNGFDLCQIIRSEMGLKTPILMLTALNETEDVVEGLDRGADDYLGKPFEFKELLARIRALARRGSESVRPEVVLKVGDLILNHDNKEVRRGQQLIHLTPREFFLLDYLMRHSGRVVSRAELLEQVWKVSFDPGTNIVEVYLNYLRKKIDKPFGQKLLHTVAGMGYMLQSTQPD